jgi:SAM-dependent methyltransferase
MARQIFHPHPDPLPSRERKNSKITSSPSHRMASGGEGWRSRFDLQWDDRGLFPDVVYPDADFLFSRMNEAVLESVNPRSGELILDIGCGRGIDGVELSRRGTIVIGIEPSPVMMGHALNYVSENAADMCLIQGVGEYLPLRARSVDKVLCKGALDHFAQPREVIRQMATVLKPEGKAIIAIANYESLGFKLGRAMWWLKKKLGLKVSGARMPWEVPEDHTYRFDYSSIKRLANEWLEVENISGVSLLFGLPWWGIFLAKLPKTFSLGLLKSLDKAARHIPRLGDVIILHCRPKNCCRP